MNDRWLGTPPHILLPRLKTLLTDLEKLAVGVGEPDLKEVVSIQNCILASRSVPCLIGEMIGHPTVKDGPGITSELFFFDRRRKLARSLSRWYRFDDGLL
ncbi:MULTISPECIES: hypothetical protein [Rhizobium]|uniref:hypothetical protein n=1 Tax=Rhizobium TaxID=379 RepID=UPI0013BAA358|nr:MULTISPECIES: hypothetical protein [Rhizobium]MBY3097517.1 hypothetical protein [Rhizobium laguerreae]MBY3112124.1 hypothetical protein [Rhizobium laguerreae]MBY3123492.1 hypothetical protein [Rhizobium laguerreae]MBY5384350.1 hypothetical protein [Rhizobium leguminosarum]NEH72339.1 hypothetical protein [Rhizobium leguminosarum]